jgi:hypothetical protein
MLKRYKSPDGSLWLFDEGEQPKGYVAADEPKADEPKAEQPKAKARAPRNKARTATKAK